jgi:hypothetical protein
LLAASAAFGQALPPPPGQHCLVSATEVANLTSFSAEDRVAATYYFYWYRWKDGCAGPLCDPVYARSHILFATGTRDPLRAVDALTDHPINLPSWDFEDPKWHEKQLEDITSASIEVILPVFWGVPGRYGRDGHVEAAWSSLGLKALAAALEEREKQGKPSPRVGMFYDTSSLLFESPFHYNLEEEIDLKTESGKKQFYATIRDFFSLIPPRFWALWEGHPLVWLYASEYASGFDDTLFPYVKEEFAKDFSGLSPWFAAHVDWVGAGADWIYRWGAAIQPNFLSVSAIGPGFDNSGAHGSPRGTDVKRDRQGGDFYRDAWEHALRASNPMVVIETWDELHEGTDICPTVEYGDQYLTETARYIKAFKNPQEAPPLPGPFQGEPSVSWEADGTSKGIQPVEAEDGTFRKVATADGVVLEMAASYLYFAVDDSFIFCSREPVGLEVDYFDLPVGAGSNRISEKPAIRVEYDSWDRTGLLHGMYKATDPVPLSGHIGWKSLHFDLLQARLANNQNQGADLRLVAPKGIRIRKVQLLRNNPPGK